ncbi:unnamed protein product [Spirodela intermedia]|uniref:TORTIFOLIA1/SINE1-2 N-terminal domain-containing protein n=1 Tax=Spirodela intermedia TaxID=51605 RepID=A0A7I8JKP6_SPIIN|nr:unnamed protein product [Spirodela intermedia]CAA6670042.1 unnamed protein product [Spirodela intermedia]
MGIPKHSSSSPPYQPQVVMTPVAADGARKINGGVNGGKTDSGSGGKDVKQRANFYMNKLWDRDTEAMAAAELESMARVLPVDSLPSFISAISDTRSSDKAPLRRHCLRLLSLLSRTHPPESLSPFLPRMVSSVLRRLRDPDSSVRTACVDAPLSETLLLEQDQNAQTGSAMCLAAAIEEASAAADGHLTAHFHRLIPSKPALLSLLGSIVAANGASTTALLALLVPCLADALLSEDWAARKAAAEALTHVAAIPSRHLLMGFKSSYFSFFQARRFDKVKIVRDSMNLMLEAWKDVPGALKEDEDRGQRTSHDAPSSSSSGSLIFNESDGRLSVGRRSSTGTRSSSPYTSRKESSPLSRSSPTYSSPTPAARKRASPRREKRTSSPSFCRSDTGRSPPDWKIEIAVPPTPPSAVMGKDEPHNTRMTADGVAQEQAGNQESTTGSKLDVRKLLFEKNSEQRVNKVGHVKSGSRVVPFQEKGDQEQAVDIEEIVDEDKDGDLSLIRKQLVQIENQQTSLLDLVQRFIGNSQNGIRSLESRVQGLEMALDEISQDLAVSSGRLPTANLGTHCCRIPVAEFLSSKFWRRTENRYSSQLLGSTSKDGPDPGKWEKQGSKSNAGTPVIPSVEANSSSMGSSKVSSHRLVKGQPARDYSLSDETSTKTSVVDGISSSCYFLLFIGSS